MLATASGASALTNPEAAPKRAPGDPHRCCKDTSVTLQHGQPRIQAPISEGQETAPCAQLQ